MVSRLVRTPKPVITAVNGVAAGGGLALALAGDLVIAAESARFTMAYSRIAATPDGSSTYWLPRLCGIRRAVELFYTNRVLTAQEAVEWGLATRVVADAEFPDAVRRLAAELAQGPTLALGRGKRLLHMSTTREPRDPDGAREPVDRPERAHRGLRRGRAGLRREAPPGLPGPLGVTVYRRRRLVEAASRGGLGAPRAGFAARGGGIAATVRISTRKPGRGSTACIVVRAGGSVGKNPL